MNKYILARIDKNCKASEGHRRLEKGKQVRKHQTEFMEIKHSERWKVLTVTDRKEYIPQGWQQQNETKQPQTTGNICLLEQSKTICSARGEPTSLSFPLEACVVFFFKGCTKDTCVLFLVLL